MEGNKLKILTVVGARPQIIKAAAISRAVKMSFAGRISEKILHTGQHYDTNMSEVFFSELGIPAPDYNLNVGSGMHGSQTALMISGIEKVLLAEKPDLLILFGDTNSTLAGAVAASKLHVPVAHIEAGLRSFNKSMPEEINRIMCDHASTWLFVPTLAGLKNLKREGFAVADSMFAEKIIEKENQDANTSSLSGVNVEILPKLISVNTICNKTEKSTRNSTENLNANPTENPTAILNGNQIENSTQNSSEILIGNPTENLTGNPIGNSIPSNSAASEDLQCDFKDLNVNVYQSITIDNPGVYHTGDVMYDNSLFFSDVAEERAPLNGILRKVFEDAYRRPSAVDRASEWHLKKGEYILATIHRDNNTDNPERLNAIFKALADIAEGVAGKEGITVVVPLHPRTEKMLEKILDPVLYERVVKLRDRIDSGDFLNGTLSDNPGIILLPPASFFEMISLEKGARMVITDSGGVQKEAFFFRRPCLILRHETEWVEIVECGAAKLVDADYNSIIDGYFEFLRKKVVYPEIFGDGRAAEKILSIISGTDFSK